MNKLIAALLANLLTISMVFAQDASDTLDLGVTVNGLTTGIVVTDVNNNEINGDSITFNTIDPLTGFRAESQELKVTVSHPSSGRVVIYTDDEFSDSDLIANTLFLKRDDASPNDTVPTDNVILKVFVTEIFTNGSTFGPFSADATTDDGWNGVDSDGDGDIDVDGFLFVFDKNTTDNGNPLERVLFECAGNNNVSYAKFKLGIDASNSSPGTYGRSISVVLFLQ